MSPSRKSLSNAADVIDLNNKPFTPSTVPALEPHDTVSTMTDQVPHHHGQSILANYAYPSVITARRLAEKHPSAKEDLLELAHALENLERSHQMFLHSRINIIAEKDRLLAQKETIIQDLQRRLKNRESVKQEIIEQVKAEAARDTEEEVQARIYVNENCNNLHEESAMHLATLEEVKERLRLALGGLKRPHDRISEGDDAVVGSLDGKVRRQQVKDRNYRAIWVELIEGCL